MSAGLKRLRKRRFERQKVTHSACARTWKQRLADTEKIYLDPSREFFRNLLKPRPSGNPVQAG